MNIINAIKKATTYKKVTMFFAMICCMCLLATGTSFATPQKTIAVFGDSYSTWNGTDDKSSQMYYYPYYSGILKNDVTREDQTWPNLVAKKCDAVISYRDAVSGSRLTRISAEDDTAIISRIEKSPSNVGDLVILMGGLNDLWQDVMVGEISKDLLPTAYEYAPALQRALRILKMKNQSSEIVYSFIVYGAEAQEYRSVAEEICRQENVRFVPITEIDCISYHPTVKGMEMIANTIVNSLYAD